MEAYSSEIKPAVTTAMCCSEGCACGGGDGDVDAEGVISVLEEQTPNLTPSSSCVSGVQCLDRQRCGERPERLAPCPQPAGVLSGQSAGG